MGTKTELKQAEVEKAHMGSSHGKIQEYGWFQIRFQIRLDLEIPRMSTSICPCPSSVFQCVGIVLEQDNPWNRKRPWAAPGVGTVISANSALEDLLDLDIKEEKNPRQ